jgi:6-pyruvoyltetrahydropterin/6-carboxytetrahydropterin synthase
MFEISKTARFEAGHHIEGHVDPITGGPGKCSRKHGHSYVISVVIRCDDLQPIGFVFDYYWLGYALDKIKERYDHQYLNDMEEFRAENATAEVIARRVYDLTLLHLAQVGALEQLNQVGAYIYYTECRETASTYARYYPIEEA